MFMYAGAGLSSDLLKLTEYYLDQVDQHGGCFHLWGHSWEITENQLWDTFESLLSIMANRPGFQYIQNRDLIK